ERHLAHHVDPAQVGAELEAIEKSDFTVDARDVPEVKIPMALAHEAGLFAFAEHASERLALVGGPAFENIEAWRVFGIGERGAQRREVLERRLRDSGRRAEGVRR